jgi:hypothetical protein
MFHTMEPDGFLIGDGLSMKSGDLRGMLLA